MRASFDYSGSRVAVTGASRGIGRAVAAAFAKAGAETFVLAENDAALDAAEQLSAEGNVRGIVCDISNRDHVREAFAEIGKLDVLIANAGIERATPLRDPDLKIEQSFRDSFEVNVFGTFYSVREALPALGSGGRVILTSSIWGKTAVADFSAYVATKHALIGLTRSWAKELGPDGITVNAVCPGWVETESAMNSLRAMAEKQNVPAGDLLDEIVEGQSMDGLMQPEDIVGLYLFLASAAAANITGQAISIDRGETLL